MCGCLSSESAPPSAGSDAGQACDGSTQPCPLACKPITKIEILSVKFLSDHDMLKGHDADWEDGGARFPKPEWTPANQSPVSHSMYVTVDPPVDKLVELEVTIEVSPANACPETGDLQGNGPGGMVFKKAGVSFAAGQQKITLSSDKGLEKKIQELDFKVRWTSPGTSVPVSPGETSNKMFVTMGVPETPRMAGVTLKRMRHAVAGTGSATSLDPHTIVKHVIGKWSRFNLSVAYPNDWELAEDRRYPAGHPRAGQLVGADCQTIVRHTEAVIKMVGCPGTSEAIVVWAKPSAPLAAIENAWGGAHLDNPKIRHPHHHTWEAALIDHAGGVNNFEACLKFTHKGKTIYYAGGVGPKNNKSEVIRVFKTLSWVKPDSSGNWVIAQVVFTY